MCQNIFLYCLLMSSTSLHGHLSMPFAAIEGKEF